jgi:hypothetical protein
VVTMVVATSAATRRPNDGCADDGKCAPTRDDDSGSKQTRTADPLLVRQVL